MQYEPIELIKLFIVLFLAAYLAEMADVIANARPWSLHANFKYLGPLFIGWGASMAILVVQRDLGMATLLLATFATLLYVATRRFDIVASARRLRCRRVLGGAPLSVRAHPDSRLARSVFESARRGLSVVAGLLRAWRPAGSSAPDIGSAIRTSSPTSRPTTSTLLSPKSSASIGALIVLAIFIGLVRRIFAAGLEQPDLYTKLLADGLGATLGFKSSSSSAA